MPLLDAAGINCKNIAITENQAQVLIIWAKGWMLENCVSVL